MAKASNTEQQPNAELDAALAEKAALETRVTELEGKLEEATANAEDAQALKDTIAELEGQLEAAATGGAGGAISEIEEALNEKLSENAVLTAALSQAKAELQAAQEGSVAKDGGKEARGEEKPAWKKPDYNGPLTADQAIWRLNNLYTKKEEEEVETK